MNAGNSQQAAAEAIANGEALFWEALRRKDIGHLRTDDTFTLTCWFGNNVETYTIRAVLRPVERKDVLTGCAEYEAVLEIERSE